jgi:hypothetical protein
MEDDAYLQSTQYRYFIFTPEKLSQLRQQTNAIASQRLHEDLQSALLSGEITPNAASPDPGSGVHINCEKTVVANPATVLEREELTAEEELKLVSYYATACVKLCDHLKAGSGVKVDITSPFFFSPKVLGLTIFRRICAPPGPIGHSTDIPTTNLSSDLAFANAPQNTTSPYLLSCTQVRKWAAEYFVVYPYGSRNWCQNHKRRFTGARD